MNSETLRPELAAVEKLYKEHYSNLRDLALSSGQLSSQDADRILEGLGKRLGEYQDDGKQFFQWASEIVAFAAERFRFFYSLRKKYRKSVLKGIWSVLNKNRDLGFSDPTVISQGIESDVWAWVFDHLSDLQVPGTATLSTRLHAQGRFHAMTWRQTSLRFKDRFDGADVKGFGEQDGEVSVDDFGRIVATERQWCFDPGHDGDLESGEVLERPQPRPIPSPSNSLVSMKSGAPKLLCPRCKSLQSISPAKADDPSAMRLGCGHERPACLASGA